MKKWIMGLLLCTIAQEVVASGHLARKFSLRASTDSKWRDHVINAVVAFMVGYGANALHGKISDDGELKRVEESQKQLIAELRTLREEQLKQNVLLAEIKSATSK